MVKLVLLGSLFLGSYIAFGKSKKKIDRAKIVKNIGDLKGKKGFIISKNYILKRDAVMMGLLILGPPRWGKSVTLVRNMLSNNLMKCSKILMDVKGELWHYTSKFRRSLGEKCIMLELLGDHATAHINPLDFCNTYDAVRNLALEILTSAATGPDGEEWANNSLPLLTAAFLYVKQLPKPYANIPHAIGILCNMPDVSTVKEKGYIDLFKECGDRYVVENVNMYEATIKAKGMAGSIKGTIFGRLNVFRDPKIIETLSKSDFMPHDFRESLINLYIKYDTRKGKYLSPVLSTIFSQLLGEIHDDYKIGQYNLPVLFLADEMQNLGRIPNLDTLATTCASVNIGLVCCCQNLTALYEIYGINRTKTILNALQTHLILPGIKDPDALQFVSLITGPTDINTTENGKTKTEKKQLLEVDEIRRITQGKVLIVPQNLNPVKDKVAYWFRSREGMESYYGKDWWKDKDNLKKYLGFRKKDDDDE